jgi:hypothetical protein
MVPTYYLEENLNHGVLLERLFCLISNLQENETNPGKMKEKLKLFIEIIKIIGVLASFVLTCMTEYEKMKQLEAKKEKV